MKKENFVCKIQKKSHLKYYVYHGGSFDIEVIIELSSY